MHLVGNILHFIDQIAALIREKVLRIENDPLKKPGITLDSHVLMLGNCYPH